MGDHADNHRDGTARAALDPGHHDVAVDDVAQLLRGDKGVFAVSVLGDKPANPARFALDGAFDGAVFVVGAGDDEAAPFELGHLALVNEREQRLTDAAAVVGGEVEDP